MQDRVALENRIQTSSLLILAVVAVAGSLYWLRPIMIPFVLSIFIWLGLSAVVEFQSRHLRIPRPLARVVTVFVAVLLSFMLGSLISASVTEFAASGPRYNEQVSQLIERIAQLLPEEGGWLGVLLQVETLSDTLLSTLRRLLADTTNAVVSILSQSVLVSVFVIFLALGGKGGGQAPSGTWAVIEARVKSYLIIKALISAFTGFLVGSILLLLDVPLAMAFGLFAFLLNFIPNVGSVIATLLPVPVVIGTPELGFTAAVLAIAVPGVIQLLIGNVLEPLLMGDSLDLHPVAILIALIFWGMLWGIVGMLLATPITAMLKILLEQSDWSRPLADLLAGRIDRLRSPQPPPSLPGA